MRVRSVAPYVVAAVLSVVASGVAVPRKFDLSATGFVSVPQVIELRLPTPSPEGGAENVLPPEAASTPSGPQTPTPDADIPRAATPQPEERDVWPFEVDAQRARQLAEIIRSLKPDLAKWLVSEIAYYTAKFTRNARATADIPPEVFISVLYEESLFRPGCRGAAGEIGMAQILPSTARGQGYNVDRLSGDVTYQVECGVAYLAGCVRSADGDLRKGLACYNGGPNPGSRSYAYADRVLRRAAPFRSTQAAR